MLLFKFCCSGYLAVPLEEYKDNIAKMVATARDAGLPNILLITPPPVDEAAWARTVSCRLRFVVLALLQLCYADL